MITTMIGEPMYPGFAGKSIPGVVADVVDKEGKPAPPGTGGFLVLKEPWPSMFRAVFNDPGRYREYGDTIPGCYTPGDLAVKNKQGDFMVPGRSDDLIVVAGHTIGTAEVTSALVSHKAVAEAAVMGKPEKVKGNVIKAFVILRIDHEPSDRLENELLYHVRITSGPAAMPSEIEFVTTLPKTRSR